MHADLQGLPGIFEPAPESALGSLDSSGPAEGIRTSEIPTESAKTVDAVLVMVGRRGGPSEYGWHSQEAKHLCPRFAHYNSRAGGAFGDETSTALGVGSVFHEYLAERYASRNEGRTLMDVVEKVERTTSLLKQFGHETVADEARRLYYGYAVKYDPADEFVDRHKVLAVEKLFYRDLPWGQRYSGRADLVLEAPDGVIIVDHKTTRARDAEWQEGWILDPAQIGLQWLVEREYKHVSGYYINGVVKTVKLDTRTDFPRFFFASEKRLIREWLDMMRYRFVEHQNARLAGYPPNFAMCLTRRGDGFRRCRWFNACAVGLRPTAKLLPSL